MDEVTAEMRRIAKTINFGIIYGISGFGLANRTGLSNEEAQTFINQYFERYPGVKEYMEVTKHKAKAQGYVQTVLGRSVDISRNSTPGTTTCGWRRRGWRLTCRSRARPRR